MSYAIVLGDQHIDLADDVDITELKSEVVRNVHASGGWVALHTTSGIVEVFVSIGQYISITQSGE